MSVEHLIAKHNFVSGFNFTISSNQTNANLRTLAVNAGWDQTVAVTATIGSNVYISSTSTATPALTIDGSWPNGVILVNNGYILGKGGNGGGGQTLQAGFAGGDAISLGTNVTITNNGIIGGGGGGGYGGGTSPNYKIGGGGGAGGGTGGAGAGQNTSGQMVFAAGGAGASSMGASGSPGSGWGAGLGGSAGGSAGYGVNFTYQQFRPYPWGGGFWVSVTAYAAGGGGGGGWIAPGTRTQSSGGTTVDGGSGGQAGGSGGGGGGWGAAGGSAPSVPGAVGGAAGYCVRLNGYTATFSVAGTRFGTVG